MVSYRPFVGKLCPWHAFFLLIGGISLAFAGVELDRMLLLAGQRYGNAGVASVIAWRDLLTSSVGQPETAKLKQVNDFFNRKIRFGEDSVIWGVPDYWATPLETLGRGEGDCEDFAIAKYMTLKLMGVPSAKMRLTYVKARGSSTYGAELLSGGRRRAIDSGQFNYRHSACITPDRFSHGIQLQC
jgi:hypothetical protein